MTAASVTWRLELSVLVEEPAAHPVPPQLAVLGPAGGGGAVLQPAVDHTDQAQVPEGHLPHQPHQGEALGRPVSTEDSSVRRERSSCWGRRVEDSTAASGGSSGGSTILDSLQTRHTNIGRMDRSNC